jgi:hypothetical protein
MWWVREAVRCMEGLFKEQRAQSGGDVARVLVIGYGYTAYTPTNCDSVRVSRFSAIYCPGISAHGFAVRAATKSAAWRLVLADLYIFDLNSCNVL